MKVTIHCIECGSTELVMLNVKMVWDVDAQDWVYADNNDPYHLCIHCGSYNDNFEEKEVKL